MFSKCILPPFLHSGSANDFLYTRQGRSPVIDGVDDTKELCTTRNAFTLLGNLHALTYKNKYMFICLENVHN